MSRQGVKEQDRSRFDRYRHGPIDGLLSMLKGEVAEPVFATGPGLQALEMTAGDHPQTAIAFVAV